MRPNSGQLAMRDPALAALLGIVGSDFGGEVSPFGAEFGDDYDDYGAEFGDDYGAEFGAAVAAATAGNGSSPAPSQLVSAWKNMKKMQAHTETRERLLEPNKGSTKKIERYTFSVNQALVLGTVLAFTVTNNPDTTIRPQRVTMNAPSPGFVNITEIKVANVSVTVGGILDAFQFSAVAVGQHLDLPTLSPANRASVIGNYTGFVPPGFLLGGAYTFAVSFTGPSMIVA